jgi:hypothetical protein
VTLRSRPLLFYAAMWGATLGACALVVVGYFVYRGSRFERLPIVLDGDYLMTRDEQMGFMPTPNGVTEIRNVHDGANFHVYTDARGARVNAPGDQTADPVDVLALGCSFTWGSSVESPQTYIQQVHDILGVSVANLAMGSFGSVQSLFMLMRNTALRPKVVVYGFIRDHLRRNVAPCAPNFLPYCLPVAYLQRRGDEIVLEPPPMEIFSPEENRDFMAEVATRDARGPSALWYRTKWAAKIALRERLSPTLSVDQSPETAAEALRVMVRAMADEAHKIGAKFVVLYLPYLAPGQVRPVTPELTAALAGLDVTLVDFGPVATAYYAAHPGGTLITDDRLHPNPAAHRMIAETLASAVRPLLSR